LQISRALVMIAPWLCVMMSKRLFTIFPKDFIPAGRLPVFQGALTMIDRPATALSCALHKRGVTA